MTCQYAEKNGAKMSRQSRPVSHDLDEPTIEIR